KLFEDVSIKFTPGNCYGVIGANGAGKSTFLKILSGEIDSTSGNVHLEPGRRMTFLKQDQFAYDEEMVLNVVIRGHERLFDIMQETNELYAKPDFNDDDGMRVAELQAEFAEMDGWNAETDAAQLLTGLGITVDLHDKKMAELTAGQKVKVLLAQALFGNPDVLLLDEPTNNLDIKAIRWLEEFLIDFQNTVIVVSHDRHFLNKICTHMCDVDRYQIKLYVGNYDFWYESSQLAQRLLQDSNRKKEEKMKELQDFIARFSANASKAKQATSRKKTLEKISLDDIIPSSRRYPFIQFVPERELGNDLVTLENVSKSVEGVKLIDNISFTLKPKDKVAIIGRNDLAVTTLLRLLADEVTPDEGTIKWGITTSRSYLPKDFSEYFTADMGKMNLVDWLRQYSPNDQTESFLRGFLGRMLFSGEEPLKKVSVLSGGEKMRCMFSRQMLSGANALIFDDPTNHLDLESITALNTGMESFKESIIFSSHDLQFVNTIANRIIEITPKGIIDKEMTYEEYLDDKELQAKIDEMYE
ncbi:MAG: ABC-F family ATP-binding cassette domain-containing protein, partial [Culicoidibacterales bacterium]